MARPETEFLNLHAARLHLNLQEFSACLSSGRHADVIKRDLYAAAGLGVTTAPAVFVNGRQVLAPTDIDGIVKLIEEELSAVPNSSQAATTRPVIRK